MIYLLDNISYDDIDLSFGLKLLENDRLKKAMKYKFHKDRVNSVLAWSLLKFGLFNEYQMVTVPDTICNGYGKPYFSNQNLFFNLSHSDSVVGCALSRFNIGFDVQTNINNLGAIKSVFNQGELNNICCQQCPIIEATRLWTLKEAYGKYHGNGLNYNLKHFNASTISKNSWQNYDYQKVFSSSKSTYSYSVFSEQEEVFYYVTWDELKHFYQQLLNNQWEKEKTNEFY